MPRDFGSLCAVLAINNPRMILGHCQVNILEAEHLTAGNNGKRHSKAIELVGSQVTVEALQVSSILVVAPRQRVPNNVRDFFHKLPRCVFTTVQREINSS